MFFDVVGVDNFVVGFSFSKSKKKKKQVSKNKCLKTKFEKPSLKNQVSKQSLRTKFQTKVSNPS